MITARCFSRRRASERGVFDGLDLVVELDPGLVEGGRAVDDALRHRELGFLELGVVAEVDGLGGDLRGVGAPRLAPEPVLREREDGDRVLRVIRQILIEVGERVRVARELVVDGAELVADGESAEGVQIDHVERRDVVRLAAEVVLPVPRTPELEAQRLGPRVAKGRVGVRPAAEVHRPELAEVGAEHLVGVDVDDLGDVEREEDVEEEDLVAPDDALLDRLPSQPLGPLVRDVRDREVARRRHRAGARLERRRQIVLEEPEPQRARGPLAHAEHHDLEQPFV
mmetsp:Transcript_11558/g.46766  ORF Transcript_11558/g.46766 Transcript_11558/m.46766 type:complete len:283 (+) Transcript_11558:1132-1980(+)